MIGLERDRARRVVAENGFAGWRAADVTRAGTVQEALKDAARRRRRAPRLTSHRVSSGSPGMLLADRLPRQLNPDGGLEHPGRVWSEGPARSPGLAVSRPLWRFRHAPKKEGPTREGRPPFPST